MAPARVGRADRRASECQPRASHASACAARPTPQVARPWCRLPCASLSLALLALKVIHDGELPLSAGPVSGVVQSRSRRGESGKRVGLRPNMGVGTGPFRWYGYCPRVCASPGAHRGLARTGVRVVLHVRAVLPGLIDAELVAEDDHEGVEQAAAATRCLGQKYPYFALHTWKWLVGSHGIRRLRSTARRLVHGDDRTMRYVRGTPAADRPMARRWHAPLIRAASMNDLLSRSRSASPATTDGSSDCWGVRRTHQLRAGRSFMPAFCEGAGPPPLRTTQSIRAIGERKRVTGRIKREYNTTRCWNPTPEVLAASEDTKPMSGNAPLERVEDGAAQVRMSPSMRDTPPNRGRQASRRDVLTR